MSLQHPAAIARAQRTHLQKMQDGTILSFTTIAHPPAGFPHRPRTIGLIELNDGTRVLGELASNFEFRISNFEIGQHVIARKRLSHITEQGLRVYSICYEPIIAAPMEQKQEFPGYILALTGPSGVGKTTVSTLLTTKIGKVAMQVPIFTTREPKRYDEEEYCHITKKEFHTMKKSGEIIAATRIPSRTESRWYGYRAADIVAIWEDGKIPIVITEMGLLQGLAQHFGRRSILSCGLLPPGKSKRIMLSCLLHRLRTRGRDSEESIRDRMKNAERDLDFFRKRRELFDHLIVNEDLDLVLKALKGHVLNIARS